MIEERKFLMQLDSIPRIEHCQQLLIIFKSGLNQVTGSEKHEKICQTPVDH